MSINPITPRTDTVIVLQGDDDKILRDLKAEVERIKKAEPKKPLMAQTLDDLGPTEQWEADLKAAQEAHDTFAEEAKERGVKVILRALGRKTYRDLIAAHPARDGNESDKDFGANVDDLQEALVPLCMASPAGSNEERAAFLDSLNEGQFGDLAVRAWQLNIGRTADPTQRLSSVDSRTSAATSN